MRSLACPRRAGCKVYERSFGHDALDVVLASWPHGEVGCRSAVVVRAAICILIEEEVRVSLLVKVCLVRMSNGIDVGVFSRLAAASG